MRRLHRPVRGLLAAAIGITAYSAKSQEDQLAARRSAWTTEIELHGTATGGVLCLSLWYRPAYVFVETEKGESAEALLKRLAAIINANDPFGWFGNRSKLNVEAPNSVKVAGNTLSGLGDGLFWAGTDEGFDIPKPVQFLTGCYEEEQGRLVLRWRIPPQEHDRVICSGRTLPPGTSMCVFDRADLSERWESELRVPVIVMRGKTPSCASVITVYRSAQEDVNDIPFFGRVMPNWATWSANEDPSAVEFSQGRKEGVEAPVRLGVDGPDSRGFYQIIRARRPEARGGIWRKFLGLKPGHTYRISVRASTLKAPTSTNEWSFSIHAAYNTSDGEDFTGGQLAGREALPNGQRGDAAGRFALFDRVRLSSGGWVKCSTADSPTASAIQNITLPQGVDSITVWTRLTGLNRSGVAVDWVRIEDVSLEK